MPRIVRFHNTAMIIRIFDEEDRAPHFVYEMYRGWVPTEELILGDYVSTHMASQSFAHVVSIEEEVVQAAVEVLLDPEPVLVRRRPEGTRYVYHVTRSGRYRVPGIEGTSDVQLEPGDDAYLVPSASGFAVQTRNGEQFRREYVVVAVGVGGSVEPGSNVIVDLPPIDHDRPPMPRKTAFERIAEDDSDL